MPVVNNTPIRMLYHRLDNIFFGGKFIFIAQDLYEE